MTPVVFVDTEVDPTSGKVLDYGAAVDRNTYIHTRLKEEFLGFISHNCIGSISYACGHNIVHHDAKYIGDLLIEGGITELIDTLYLSPLLFPNKPYHALVKDEKIQTDELNNPLNDSIKAMELFYDEIHAFERLDEPRKDIYADLLCPKEEFQGFFSYVKRYPRGHACELIRQYFRGKICENCNLEQLVSLYPVELAYALALISAEDQTSIIPPWVGRNYPAIPTVLLRLRGTACAGCPYCDSELNIHRRLKQFFGYDDFRTYDGERLQETATQAAMDQKSLLAVFPTGGGKSITFQLPALIAGETMRALTVVISPLQSLMKDQVDNIEKRGLADAVTINGLLNPIERAEAIERVESGVATILYISPESLRSNTVGRMLEKRNIARFVIDEAHCFSAWGQDFRVDYLYIGDFIHELQEKKQLDHPIPVSCFTATAKQKVISDIKDYFKEKLGLELEIFASAASRKNLRYEVLFRESEEEKYATLRLLIEQKNCPTIVYASRTKRTQQLAEKLCADGFLALAFNGKMERNEKQENQERFIRDEVQVMVATSAFGMGVDKPNVKLVIHYDISDSLENYVQEAGRAGRDQNLEAECYVLYNDGDLDKHFIMLNQTKLSISEIQQVWKAIKDLTKTRSTVSRTAFEIARQAGWDENVAEMETRVKTAIHALENAGYIKRGKNMPKVFADSILAHSMIEVSGRIEKSQRLDAHDKQEARRILSMLISARSSAKGQKEEGESRVDYLADRLGLERTEAFRLIGVLKEEGILADTRDLTAYIQNSDTEHKVSAVVRKYADVEEFLLHHLAPEGQCVNLKELNDLAINSGVKNSSVNVIKTIFYYWTIKSYIQKSVENTTMKSIVVPQLPWDELWLKRAKNLKIASHIIRYLFEKRANIPEEERHGLIPFSVLELRQECQKSGIGEVSVKDVEDALLYLSKIDAMKLEGGFLVLYNGMQITRLEMDNRIKYKADDYKSLDEYYRQKMQQIHIVGEFANMMLKNYWEALEFVNEYFHMDYRAFIAKYFKGNRKNEINRNITPQKFNQLFGDLSDAQRAIIDDDSSRYIVVAAGPGSGKTKVLVHKLASLIMLEDVKHEQLLMVTFSRAAATEFKKRLYDLIGNAASFIEIKTFHSYCFDLLGRIGSLNSADTVVQDASGMIKSGEVEPGRITKSVLVIDEAQDMDEHEFELVSSLIERNDDLRVIAVGDDDQNIYEFRGSKSKYFESFLEREDARLYELLDNYRSAGEIVDFANTFVTGISNRLKKTAIRSKKSLHGEVRLIQCRSSSLEEPVAVRASALCRALPGQTLCVLTGTNAEAVSVVGVLKQKGINARLIQTNDGFDLYNMLEIRYFLMKIEAEDGTAVIDDKCWNDAREALKNKYAASENLGLCLNMLEAFELSCQKKYRSDFDIFLHESRLEDFFRVGEGEVVVSTIHKSKGREFDQVMMLLANYRADEDEQKRTLYVGMTRAKAGLHIFYNGSLFDPYMTGNVHMERDGKVYDKPEQMLVQLTHKDVILSYFKDKRDIIRRLMGGIMLNPEADGLCVTVDGKQHKIVLFADKFKKELEAYSRQGYHMSSAKIRFVVGWTDKNDGTECPIVLPDIYFTC